MSGRDPSLGAPGHQPATPQQPNEQPQAVPAHPPNPLRNFLCSCFPNSKHLPMAGSDPPLEVPPGHQPAPPLQPDEQQQAVPAHPHNPFVNFLLSVPPDLGHLILSSIPATDLPPFTLSCKAAHLWVCSTAVTSMTFTRGNMARLPPGMTDRYPALTCLVLKDEYDGETFAHMLKTAKEVTHPKIVQWLVPAAKGRKPTKKETPVAEFLHSLSMEGALLARVTRLDVSSHDPAEHLSHYIRDVLDGCTSLKELSVKLLLTRETGKFEKCQLIFREERPGRQLPPGMGGVFAGMRRAMVRPKVSRRDLEAMLGSTACRANLQEVAVIWARDLSDDIRHILQLRESAYSSLAGLSALSSLTLHQHPPQHRSNSQGVEPYSCHLPSATQLLQLTRLAVVLHKDHRHRASQLSDLHLPELKELALDGGNSIGTVEYSLPTGMQALTKLSMSREARLSPPHNIRTLTSLQHLALHDCHLQTTDASLSAELRALTALTHLSIHRVYTRTDNGLDVVTAASLDLQGVTSLLELDTFGSAPVHIPSSLTSLVAHVDSSLSAHSFVIPATWLSATHLRCLDVHGDCLWSVHVISQLTALQHVSLAHDGRRGSHWQVDMSQLDNLTGLTHLRLVISTGMLAPAAWPQIEHAANLRYLQVRTERRTDDLVDAVVWPIPPLPSSLTRLHIHQAAADFDLPQHLTGCIQLQELHVECPHFSQLSGISHLTALTSLSRLEFSSTDDKRSDGSDATRQLEMVARLTHLQHLSLNGLDSPDVSCLDALSLLTCLHVGATDGAQLVGELPGPLLRTAQSCQRLRKVGVRRGVKEQ